MMSVNMVSDVRVYIIFNVSTSSHLSSFHRWHQFLLGFEYLSLESFSVHGKEVEI